MEFGRLPSIKEGISFALPADPGFNRLYATRHKQALCSTHYYVGCPVWSQKSWVGKWYPPNSQPKNFFYYYSRQFNSIELNSTHYALPAASTIAKWIKQSPEHFRFCPKVPQVISHRLHEGVSTSALSAFVAVCKQLRPRLGIPFLQLPPTFSTHKANALFRLLDAYPFAEIPLAIEFRHPSWFKELHPIAEKLHAYGAAMVITDVAGRRDAAHMALSTSATLIRFVGNQLHPVDYERAASWAHRLSAWAKMGLEQIYFFVHEPDNITAPELASYFIQQLNQHLPSPLRPPQAYEQTSLF